MISLIPPSTSISTFKFAFSTIFLNDSIFFNWLVIKLCHPYQGFTVITNIKSILSRTYFILSSGVSGFNANQDFFHRSLIDCNVLCK